jgi:hypothetical protein
LEASLGYLDSNTLYQEKANNNKNNMGLHAAVSSEKSVL